MSTSHPNWLPFALQNPLEGFHITSKAAVTLRVFTQLQQVIIITKLHTVECVKLKWRCCKLCVPNCRTRYDIRCLSKLIIFSAHLWAGLVAHVKHDSQILNSRNDSKFLILRPCGGVSDTEKNWAVGPDNSDKTEEKSSVVQTHLLRRHLQTAAERIS